MTQTTDTTEVLRQLGKLTTVVESIQTDVQEIKVSQARTEERFNSIDQRINSLETRLEDFKKSSDTQIADLKKSTETQFADLKKTTEAQIADFKKSTETQFADMKVQLRSQDNRLWTFLAALFLAVLGFAAKLILFPGGSA